MEAKPSLKRDIHGFSVLSDESVKHGLDYLDYDLQYEEAKVFFDEARLRGEAQFEDDHEHQYVLRRNDDGTYALTGRKAGGGGFFSGWF